MGCRLKKNSQLGMDSGTAYNRLKKIVMFELVKLTKRSACHQCGKDILSPAELSIEHKTPWLDSSDPINLFYSLDNIAFSHLKCNSFASRRKKAAST